MKRNIGNILAGVLMLSLFVYPLWVNQVKAQAATSTATTTATSTEQAPKIWIYPDSIFYPIKLLLEKVRLAFTFGAEDKAKEYQELANKRFAEYKVMVDKGDYKDAEGALERYKGYLEKATGVLSAIYKSDSAQEVIKSLREDAGKRLEEVKESLAQVPDDTKKKYNEAVQGITDEVKRISDYLKK